jgi:hypothetical protein
MLTVPKTLKKALGNSTPIKIVLVAKTPIGNVKAHHPILNGNFLIQMLQTAKKHPNDAERPEYQRVQESYHVENISSINHRRVQSVSLGENLHRHFAQLQKSKATETMWANGDEDRDDPFSWWQLVEDKTVEIDCCYDNGKRETCSP